MRRVRPELSAGGIWRGPLRQPRIRVSSLWCGSHREHSRASRGLRDAAGGIAAESKRGPRGYTATDQAELRALGPHRCADARGRGRLGRAERDAEAYTSKAQCGVRSFAESSTSFIPILAVRAGVQQTWTTGGVRAEADSVGRARLFDHQICPPSTAGGIVIPRAFAVLRLMTSSILSAA